MHPTAHCSQQRDRGTKDNNYPQAVYDIANVEEV